MTDINSIRETKPWFRNTKPRSIEERFWERVFRSGEDECWEWIAYKNHAGYGTIKFNGSQWLAHRVSWVLQFGAIPDGMFVCHHCDNRGCVNPKHLFLGTNEDNIADKVSKGRQARMNNSPLTPDEVRRIRSLYSTGQYSHQEIGKMFGIGRSTVGRIVLKQMWGWVD